MTYTTGRALCVGGHFYTAATFDQSLGMLHDWLYYRYQADCEETLCDDLNELTMILTHLLVKDGIFSRD